MAANIVEFFGYFPAVAASAQLSPLPRQPHGATIAAWRVLTGKFTFTSSVSGGGYLGCEEWLLAVQYSATNTPDAGSARRKQTLIASAGAAEQRLAECRFSVSSGQVRLLWTPYTAGRDWTIRGHLWVASAA